MGKAKLDPRDLLVLLGLASVGAGIWWIYPPAALIALGVIVLAIGLGGARQARR